MSPVVSGIPPASIRREEKRNRRLDTGFSLSTTHKYGSKHQPNEYKEDVDLKMSNPDDSQKSIVKYPRDFYVHQVLQQMMHYAITSTQQIGKDSESGNGEDLTTTAQLLMGVSQNTTRPIYGVVEERREKSAQTRLGQPNREGRKTKIKQRKRTSCRKNLSRNKGNDTGSGHQSQNCDPTIKKDWEIYSTCESRVLRNRTGVHPLFSKAGTLQPRTAR